MKPILFNTEMVRAVLNGRKTVTRRVIKPQPKFVGAQDGYGPLMQIAKPRAGVWFEGDPNHVAPYQPGDILYVRETFFREDCISDCAGRSDPDECPFNRVGNSCYGYKAQYTKIIGEIKWRPSIHMPKEAARLFLRVTEVRVERLQDITSEGKTAEGMNCGWQHYNFYELWDSTIKPVDCDKYGWDANPWVWVIEFERVGRTRLFTAEKGVAKNEEIYQKRRGRKSQVKSRRYIQQPFLACDLSR